MPFSRRELPALFAGGLAALAPGAVVARPAVTKAPPTKASSIKVATIAKGLNHPWGLQFLPEGQMLVTERPGTLRIVAGDGKLSPPIAGVPQVWANGQGGLLDVALAPDFATSGRIVLAYAASRGALSGGGTAVATARLVPSGLGGRLEGVSVIFQQDPSLSGGLHFGCRLVFARDGTLFIALGDRGRKEGAQDLGGHLGKVLRLNLDGAVPADNPFRGQSGKKPEIWSYGHRNIQGAALHPVSGKLWIVEHGPRGGDEINIADKGKNYGWPTIGYGIDYSGAKIHDAEAKEGMEQPLYYWRPSIAPSGMCIHSGQGAGDWKGNVFVGALLGQALHRLVFDGEAITGEEVLLKDRFGRIRDVRESPDGSVVVLTDDPQGGIVRVSLQR